MFLPKNISNKCEHIMTVSGALWRYLGQGLYICIFTYVVVDILLSADLRHHELAHIFRPN